jgi:uncharacterized membrane protein YdjX (TVP38/TMEM64 family)
MIVDDTLLRIGSANLSNRSMGLDTECDMALEADGEGAVTRAIADLRHRLLAEHLGTDPEKVAERLAGTGSLLKTIEQLRGLGRTLKPFNDDIPAELDAWIPEAAVIDPDRPLDSDAIAEQFVPDGQRRLARRRLITIASLLLALIALGIAWQWTPLREWLDVPALVGYTLGALAVIPITILIAITILAFGSWLGFTYSLAGTLISAALTYGLGQLIGRQWVRRLAGARLNRLSRQLAKRGVLAVLVVRVVPVAPFTVVNLVAGASHIRFRDFMLGTTIGMLPGLLGMTVFMDRLIATFRDPGPRAITAMVLVLGILIAGALTLRRWLEKTSARDDVAPPGTA